jgi:hypothetical protein
VMYAVPSRAMTPNQQYSMHQPYDSQPSANTMSYSLPSNQQVGAPGFDSSYGMAGAGAAPGGVAGRVRGPSAGDSNGLDVPPAMYIHPDQQQQMAHLYGGKLMQPSSLGPAILGQTAQYNQIQTPADYGFGHAFDNNSAPYVEPNTAPIVDENQLEGYVDGAVHLSAGAKPFVPKYATSPSLVGNAMQMPSMSRDRSTSETFLGLGGVGSSPPSLPPISLSPRVDTSTWPSVLQGTEPQPLAASWSRSQMGASGEISLGPFSNHSSSASVEPMLDTFGENPLDILHLNGIVDPLSLDGHDMDDLGGSLLGRYSGERRRSRGLLFQSTSSGASRYLSELGDDGKFTEDEGLLPLNQLISDVINSPDTPLFNPGHIFSGNQSS